MRVAVIGGTGFIGEALLPAGGIDLYYLGFRVDAPERLSVVGPIIKDARLDNAGSGGKAVNLPLACR